MKNVAVAVTTDVQSAEVPSISTHAGSQTSTPLIHCRTDDVVMQVAALLYQSLLQVVDITNSCVN